MGGSGANEVPPGLGNEKRKNEMVILNKEEDDLL